MVSLELTRKKMFEFTFSVRMWNKKGLNLYSSLLTHQTGAYPGFHAARSDQEYHYSPLDGMLVHCKATPPAFYGASLTICQYPLILLGGERHGQSKVFCPRTRHIDLAKARFSKVLVTICKAVLFPFNTGVIFKLSAIYILTISWRERMDWFGCQNRHL